MASLVEQASTLERRQSSQDGRNYTQPLKISSRKSSATSTISTDGETPSTRFSRVINSMSLDGSSLSSPRMGSGSSGSSRIRRRQMQMPKLYSSCPTPLAMLGFSGSRLMVTERLPSAGRERPTTLRVLELSEQAINCISNESENLKRLDLSKLRMNVLPEKCMQRLVHLERLDVSHNILNDESFPRSLENMEKLLELTAVGNKLTAIPNVVCKLKSLQRLKLAFNNINCTNGLEKLRRLSLLVLDHNQIETIRREIYVSLKRLELFHLSNNRLKELHSDIRYLRHLKDIDVSNNQLSTLPVELFLLPRIDIINASNNHIIRLPSVVIKNKSRKKLSSIDLSGNVLGKLPDHLLTLTERLDLGGNRIRSIPAKVLKILDSDHIDELILEGNPLVSPPIDVCECGIKSIIRYLQEARSEMKVHQGVKVLVVGSYLSGKTSLVQSLVDQQSRLVEENDRTIGVDQYDTTFDLEEGQPMGKSLQLTILDFSGHPNYLFSHYTFLQQPSLVLLTFNLSTYNPDQFHDVIGKWIDWNLVKTNKLVLLLVGTHADKVKNKNVVIDICTDVSIRLTDYTSGHVKTLEREIKKIENEAHISPAMSEQLKVYINLLKLQATIFDKVVVTSSATLAGFTELQNAIIEMSSNKKTFPNVMRQIPSLWTEVENYLDEKGYAMQVPMISWEKYVNDITRRFGMKHLIDQITQYLQETGKVIWFEEHPTLRNWVILRPSWLADIIKPLFRPEFGDSSSTEDSLKQLGITQQRFDRMKTEMLEDGIVSREMLKFLWHGVVPYEAKSSFNDVIIMLLDDFEFGYAVDKSSKAGNINVIRQYERSVVKDDDTQSVITVASHQSIRPFSKSAAQAVDSRPPSEADDVPFGLAHLEKSRALAISRILIPLLRTTPMPDDFKEEYERFIDNSVLVANFRFPHYIPPGIFETLEVRAVKHHDMDVLYHWKDGLYARHVDDPVRMYLLRINHSDGCICVRIELRHETKIDDEGVENLWTTMLPYVLEVDNLLLKYSGLRVERNMECPKCHALTFLGEWQTPKEIQSIASKICENCKNVISTVYLIQPKEKRRVEEFLKQRLKEEQERKRREEDAQISSIPEVDEFVDPTSSHTQQSSEEKSLPKTSSISTGKQGLRKKQTKSSLNPRS